MSNEQILEAEMKGMDGAIALLIQRHRDADMALHNAKDEIAKLRQIGQELETLFIRFFTGEIGRTDTSECYNEIKAEHRCEDKKLFE